MDKTNRRYTTVCLECDVDLSDERIHLGYTTCLDCSSTEKYSSHTIYPHKTGGYIQPVSSEKSDELKRLDRRGISSNRKAKGIFADKSWDRWLEQYYNPPPKKPKRISKPVTNIFIPYREVIKTIVEKYDKSGYDAACQLTQSLYSNDRISLMNKSKIMNELASLQMMTTKQRKWMKKL